METGWVENFTSATNLTKYWLGNFSKYILHFFFLFERRYNFRTVEKKNSIIYHSSNLIKCVKIHKCNLYLIDLLSYLHDRLDASTYQIPWGRSCWSVVNLDDLMVKRWSCKSKYLGSISGRDAFFTQLWKKKSV